MFVAYRFCKECRISGRALMETPFDNGVRALYMGKLVWNCNSSPSMWRALRNDNVTYIMQAQKQKM